MKNNVIDYGNNEFHYNWSMSDMIFDKFMIFIRFFNQTFHVSGQNFDFFYQNYFL